MRTKFYTLTALFVASFALTGCISEDKQIEGISMSGGNAIAHNSALQIVDPWPAGVQDTTLEVPADRGADTADAATAAPSPAPVAAPAPAT